MNTTYVIAMPTDKEEENLLNGMLNFLEKQYEINTYMAICVESEEPQLDDFLRGLAVGLLRLPEKKARVQILKVPDPIVKVEADSPMANNKNGRKCVLCGEPVISNRRKNSKYCSTKCYMKDYRKHYIKPTQSTRSTKASDREKPIK